MSKDLFEKPQAVIEAAKAQKGLHWSLEFLVFVAVFIVSSLAMAVVMVPIELVMLYTDADYINAVAANDLNAILEASMKLVSSDIYTVLMLVADAIMILIVFLFCKLLQKRKMTTLGFCKKDAVKEYLVGLLAGFVCFSAAVLFGVFTGGLKLEGLSPTFSIGIFLLYAIGFMIQGMAEEVICRGYFMVSFARRYPLYAAVLINSIGFAALHLTNSGITVLAFINLSLFGIFASLYFIRRGNIWGIGAFHSIWNLVQGNFYGIKVSGMELSTSFLKITSVDGKEMLSGGDFGLEGSIFVTVVLVIGIVILYLGKRNGDFNE